MIFKSEHLCDKRISSLCATTLITAVNQALVIFVRHTFYKYRYEYLVILILHNLI